jgi:hypothetical protein
VDRSNPASSCEWKFEEAGIPSIHPPSAKNQLQRAEPFGTLATDFKQRDNIRPGSDGGGTGSNAARHGGSFAT